MQRLCNSTTSQTYIKTQRDKFQLVSTHSLVSPSIFSRHLILEHNADVNKKSASTPFVRARVIVATPQGRPLAS